MRLRKQPIEALEKAQGVLSAVPQILGASVALKWAWRNRVGVAKPGGRRMPKHRCAPLGGMLLQDLGEIQLYVWPKVGLAPADFYFGKRQATRGDRVAPF